MFGAATSLGWLRFGVRWDDVSGGAANVLRKDEHVVCVTWPVTSGSTSHSISPSRFSLSGLAISRMLESYLWQLRWLRSDYWLHWDYRLRWLRWDWIG